METAPLTTVRPRVVIIGAGFGGLQAAKRLRHAPVDVTLINRTNYHLFQPLLYQVAMAALPAGDIAHPLRTIFRKQKNITILMDEVAEIDRQNRQVRLASGTDPIAYDYLIVAVGNQPSYFGKDEWAARAPGLKTLQNAMDIRERIILAFEQAYKNRNHPTERAKYLTFVCVGGGPTGVEMAGAISEIGRKTMTRDFPGLDKGEIRVFLVEGSDRVLGTFPPSLSDSARRSLEQMGVQVLTKTLVKEVGPDYVLAGGTRIETVNVIWAAGNTANPLVKQLNAQMDRAGRVIVKPDCALPDDENIFVIGDAAHIPDAKGNPLPGVAQVAIQSGHYVGEVIRSGARRSFRPPFRYFDKGNMATIGRAKAVAEVGKLKVSGFWAWMMWLFIHLIYLVGFRNRVSVMVQWFWYYITFQPGSRILFWREDHTTVPPDCQGQAKEPSTAKAV